MVSEVKTEVLGLFAFQYGNKNLRAAYSASYTHIISTALAVIFS